MIVKTIILSLLLTSVISCQETKKNNTVVSEKESPIDSAIVNVPIPITEKITLRMYSTFDENCVGDKCESKILVSSKGTNFKAIHYDCSNEYGLFNYLEGPLNNKSISGNSMDFDNCGGDAQEGDPEMCLTKGKFSIQFLKDSTKFKYNKYNKYDEQYFLVTKIFSLTKMSYIFETKVQNLLSEPLKSSKIVTTINEKDKIELLEIGNIEKTKDEWKVWIKLKANGFVGWNYNIIVLY